MLKRFIIGCILLILCIIPLLWIGFRTVAGEVVVIQFASWGSESEVNIIKPLLVDFERENPDIKVDFMHIPQNYFQKIHLLFASNTAPDVIFMNNQYLPVYANAGVLEDLTNLDFDFDVFYSKAMKSMMWKGKIYAVPRDVSNLVVFYNKDLFKKYGIPYPVSGWSFDDFLTAAVKITNSPYVFGISFEEDPLFYLPYMTSCGGWQIEDTTGFFDNDVLSKPANKKGLDFYSDLRNKYHIAPYKQEAASATMAQMFLQGRLGMQVSGRWLVPKYREEANFDWDIVEFPACKKGGQSIVPLDSSGWTISKSSKHKKEAVRLIKYLSSAKSIEKFAKSGLIVPARIDTANSAAFLDNKKPAGAGVFLKIIDQSVPTPVTINYREILDALKIKNEYIFNKN